MGRRWEEVANVNPIQRYKGLGEMNAEDLWVLRWTGQASLLQVTDDAAAADQMFSILMGEDVEQHRSFIQRNAKDVRFSTSDKRCLTKPKQRAEPGEAEATMVEPDSQGNDG